ncbi:DJ-1/PfpI family protein [Microbispora sitophila]|uniref:DJ-1/PfpI family protein n=1 Tax=Microbispora sitophila TaxID=2771537 RepID=UPI001D0054D4|nr:DJ-1/PfpI family protein [Microbispora sitophila]
MPMLAQFVLFDGFDPLDVLAPYEVLTAAAMFTRTPLTATFVTAEGPREVAGGVPGVSLRATAPLDPARADLVVLPGAAGDVREEEGLTEEERQGTVTARLGNALTTGLPRLMGEALGRQGVTVATVCGGSLLLAMAGLIRGRHVTGHHLGLDALNAFGAVAVDARVVDDGDLVSGAGVTSGLDLGLYLVEREFGPHLAHDVERLFAHERRGVVWRERRPSAPAAR